MILLIMIYSSLIIDTDHFSTFDECEKAAKASIGIEYPNLIDRGFYGGNSPKVVIAFCAKGHTVNE